MCAALGICKRTYYKYRNQIDPDYTDYLLIKQVFRDSKCTYGYRRIKEGLMNKYGAIFNHKKIKRLMKQFDLKPKYIRKIRPNVHWQRIKENVVPDLVKRRFNPSCQNKIWCTDVTYLIFRNRRAYLSSIIDLYSRKIIAYEISFINDISLVINTLNKALRIQKDVRGLTLHSDQGFQYTSYEYKAICNSKGIQISMSRAGTPIDDSPIESWHSLLKKEVLYNNDIISIEHYIKLVKEWIHFYNTDRIKIRKPKVPNF